MRIKKVRFRNGYKRFHDLTIDLGENPARIVVLVGPNGCGKSSVLDGMLYHHAAFGRLGRNYNRTTGYHSLDGKSDYSYLGISIEFDEGTYQQVRDKRGARSDTTTIFSFRSPYRYNTSVLIDSTRATEDIGLNNYGAGDASSLDEKMEENYRRLQAMVTEIGETKDIAPSLARSEVIGDLNLALKNCLGLEISSVGNVAANKGTLYFKKDNQPSEFNFNVLSSGEKEVVDILLDLYLRKNAYTNTIFLIDEPELHVNTSIQGKLLAEINKMIGENCQLWITTHSLGFLRLIQSELKDCSQVIQFKDSDRLAMEERVLTPVSLTPATWRDLFAVALDDISELVCPETIIFCEGRHDTNKSKTERGLDAQVFNQIFGNNGVNAHFVSSGGNTELEQRADVAIAIIGKALPTVNILVLKDRDMASGKPTNEAIRQEYLRNHPDHHRVLKRFEIENYLFDKEVLKAYTVSHGRVFDEATYDKFITDIENEDVKGKLGIVKNCCEVTGPVDEEKFKINLAAHITSNMNVYKDLYQCVFARK